MSDELAVDCGCGVWREEHTEEWRMDGGESKLWWRTWEGRVAVCLGRCSARGGRVTVIGVCKVGVGIVISLGRAESEGVAG